MSSQSVPVHVKATTKYIISTSGRVLSLQRYDILLHEILGVDVAYIPISSNDPATDKISPQAFAWALKGLPCLGGSISKDIKHGIVPFIDELHSTASAVQSVNTVIVDGSRLIGYNTDVHGFQVAIEAGISSSNVPVQRAVCYGYGGVVSVVVAVLRSLNIEVFITGRRVEEATRRAQELGVSVWDESIQVDLLVNAAPVTDKPLQDAPNLLEALRSCKVVFDHEMPGKYLREYCQEHGIHHIAGTDMYYPQMLMQWGLFLKSFNLDENTLTDALQRADELAKQRLA